jgi:drug/metabolite transporter (DMT)-like permease
MWFSSGIVFVGLLMTAGASIALSSKNNDVKDHPLRAWALVLMAVSQLFSGGYIVVCDYVLHSMFPDICLFFGLQGVCGLVMVCGICLPIAHFFGEYEGEGIHEDFNETLESLGKNKMIVVLCLIYVLLILVGNIFTARTVNATDAVTYSIIMQLRLPLVWIVGLVIFHGFDEKEIGEEWSDWSFLEVGGFVVVGFGVILYLKVIKLPCFKYPTNVIPYSEVQNLDATVNGEGMSVIYGDWVLTIVRQRKRNERLDIESKD